MAGSWSVLTNSPSFIADTMLLLTDGSIMCHEYNSNKWHKLKPDIAGSYVNGEWSNLAPMKDDPSIPANLGGPTIAPLYFASAVLADGTVFFAGGEYNSTIAGADINTVQIYNPLTDAWQIIGPPAGWSQIGDSPSCVLPDGRLLLGNSFATSTAIYNPKSQTWTTAANKNDSSSEETFTLLPNNTILTVQCSNIPNAEKYIIATDKWVSAGATPSTLPQGCPGIIAETGPSVLLPDGRVFVVGATGNTALYTAPTVSVPFDIWTAGPVLTDGSGNTSFPMDAGAALLPNGRVLCVGSPAPPCSFLGPSTFFEYDPVSNTASVIASPVNSALPCFNGRFLLLPTGQVLFSNNTNVISVYTPDGNSDNSWKPSITKISSKLALGRNVILTGTQLNGLSQACSYGDDAQMATNYPIAQLTSTINNNVIYLRTSNHSSMGVATGAAPQTTNVFISSDTPVGNYRLAVIANGISSDPVMVSVGPQPLSTKVLSGANGVIYSIMDNGDLLWYRHDGRDTGSFVWADNNGKKVGVGWNMKHVFTGDNGVIYAIDYNHDLLWFRHDGKVDGSFRWTDNNARKVGSGWNVKHVFSGGDGIIYVINEDNDLLWYRHDGRDDGSFKWADNNARKVGVGWNMKQVFYGGNGVIYAINDANDLLWFRHDGRDDGSFKWADDNARKVGNGWDMRNVFSGGDGIIYGIAENNDLLWFRHDGRDDGSFRWTDDKPRKVGSGWNLSHVIYAVTNSGGLMWYRHDGRSDGSFSWAFDEGLNIGIGWNMKHIFSGGNGVIYAINQNNDLLWYKHEGRGNGSFRWTDDNARKVGVGWNMKQVFYGGDGVIYAINDNNDLLWFRHEGRDDGSFNWTDNNARKVGAGWNVKQVFSGGDGIIYAINNDNDLLWFRHDGRSDGSFKWTDNNARKVGTGWNLKQVFYGGDGIIYAINDNDDLLWFRHEGRADGSFKWTDDNARKVGTGWQFKQLCCD